MKSSGPNVIPYIGMYLSDLTHTDENSNYIDKKINFPKFKMIYDNIEEFCRYQDTINYNFAKTDLYDYLYELPSINENDLYRFSYELEPKLTPPKE